MPPVPTDNTPVMDSGSFELLYSLRAFDIIPVSEYVSKRTGLTVVIAEVDGPVVDGYFCLVTEAFDDDGLPHTLEHLIFLGSEEYPYKGVLDLLANRCLASGTNAWTDTDHTCYTMETAGSEGFLALMPIFLEHILYPVLKEESFVTEVHHITGEGEDAGVVYCEMQGRENSAESRFHLAVARNVYPGHCGYSSETGGIMKNLRESTTNTKVRKYHKDFYRPENLKIIITGQVNPEDVFKALEELEQKILSKGERSPFQRPWQNPVPPLNQSKDLVIKYPTDEENNGIFGIAWRGPSSVTDLYSMTACSLILKYLTEFSASPLPQQFVEIDDPYASRVSYNLSENSETCFYIIFDDVPVAKLQKIKPKLFEIFNKILDSEDLDMKQLHNIINRYKLENLSNIESNPHHSITFLIIGHMLYGNTKADLEQRLNPLHDINKLLNEPKTYWLNILQKYFASNNYVAVQCLPSKEEKLKMTEDEQKRIEQQREGLGELGLKEKADVLENAIKFNDREPPADMLVSIPIPSFKSIVFHKLERYTSDSAQEQSLDLSETPIFTYFDNLKTNFVYIFGLIDTSQIPSNLRVYLPLLLDALLELPMERDGKLIPYEEVVAQLNEDTVSSSTTIGLNGGLFSCGNYSQTAIISLQVEAAKYEIGIEWLRNLLYKTKFTTERLKVIALKLVNMVAQAKRNGRKVAAYAMKELRYSKDSNVHINGVLLQHKFLTGLIEKLDSDQSHEVLDDLEKLRTIITKPSNLVLHLGGNLDIITDVTTPIKKLIPQEINKLEKRKPLCAIPDYKLMNESSESPSCIIGMGCLESSFFYQTVKSINCVDDPDLPALTLYLQYLKQAEGPMWKQIRGKGYAYHYTLINKVNEGLLYMVFGRATNVVGAYKETKDILTRHLELNDWDNTLLEAARSSLVFDIINEEKTIGNVVDLSLYSNFQGVDYTYNRKFLGLIEKVTVEDLNKIGKMYIKPLLDPKQVMTVVVTDPCKADEIAEGFKKLDLNLTIYPSLEESFLNVN